MIGYIIQAEWITKEVKTWAMRKGSRVDSLFASWIVGIEIEEETNW